MSVCPWYGRRLSRNRKMNAIQEAASSEATEFSKLTRLQKLAGFLLILEPDNAAHIMEQLEAPEMEAVSAEMAKISVISIELQNDILDEFLSNT